MARIARIVVPGIPHHITQRGNRRQQTFFSDADYAAYLSLMGEWCGKAGLAVWSYCLMPNHVHLIVVPERQDSLHRAIGEAHRRYTRRINFAHNWRGFLWQGRFASFPMDEAYLLAATRYVELNPVRAGLVNAPEDWPWSSARAHLRGQCDSLISPRPMQSRVADWRRFLESGLEGELADTIRKSERSGRPLGDETFITALEEQTGRALARRRSGPS